MPAAAAAVCWPTARAASARPRELSFENLHTGESLAVLYAENGDYVAESLGEINYLLRDFRNGEVHPIDPGLLDFLSDLQRSTAGRGVYQVVSGYRSPATNELLRKQGHGVARRSFHMRGMAIDVRLTGVDTTNLRDAALALHRGGVGYYRKSKFVHVDTGRVRSW